MLISAEMKAALTEQIGHEFAAMLQYVTIATYFESEGLPRLAQHFYRQAEEEREHAMRFVRYVVEIDCGVGNVSSAPAGGAGSRSRSGAGSRSVRGDLPDADPGGIAVPAASVFVAIDRGGDRTWMTAGSMH